MSRSTILTLYLLVSVLFLSTFVANGGRPGGRTKVADVKTNKEVQELGRYSVEEYNRSERSRKGGVGSLSFSQVVSAEKQVVSGIKYYLKIVAFSKSGISKVFEAEVVVKSWMHSKQLLNFKPSPANNSNPKFQNLKLKTESRIRRPSIRNSNDRALRLEDDVLAKEKMGSFENSKMDNTR
ncbi:hypothetical protein LXL04_004085 [Taraxacum kok-saghyz]